MRRRVLSLALSMGMIVQMAAFPGAAAGKQTFQDVPASHWAYPYVEQAYEQGMIQGTEYNKTTGVRRYEPEWRLTMAQLVTIITGMMYPDEVANTVWEPNADTDLNGTEWYARSYQVAYRHGLLRNLMLVYGTRGGEYPNKFHMELSLCRYQMAVLLMNAIAARGMETKKTATTAEISDWNEVTKVTSSGVFTTAVATVVHYGVMSGVDAYGRFSGWEDVTRAQAAAICCSFSDLLKKSGDDGVDTGKTGSTSGVGNGCYYPSNGPWEGTDGDVSAYIVESVPQLENAVMEALQSYTKTLMIYTHSDRVIDEIATYHRLVPADRMDEGYELGRYWDEWSSIREKGNDYAEYRFDITYDFYAYLYLYRMGKIAELPEFTYTEIVNEERRSGVYNYQPMIQALEKLQRTYGVTMQSSDYDKVRAIYSYLTDNFTYDYTYYGIKQGTEFSTTLWEYILPYDHPREVNLLLQSGGGVCAEFSRTFQAMCICFGVKCYDVSGAAGGGAHGWNIVQVDGNWYQCDPTWDIGHSADGFRYFLLSDQEMGQDHTLDRRDHTYPACPVSY